MGQLFRDPGYLRGGNQRQRAAFAVLDGLESPFQHGGFVVEFFGEPRTVAAQRAYRHMVVEARLLEIGGEPLREAVIALKLSGLKTEPAFARLLGLAGNPFEALLALETRSDGALRRLLDDLAETHGG